MTKSNRELFDLTINMTVEVAALWLKLIRALFVHLFGLAAPAPANLVLLVTFPGLVADLCRCILVVSGILGTVIAYMASLGRVTAVISLVTLCLAALTIALAIIDNETLENEHGTDKHGNPLNVGDSRCACGICRRTRFEVTV